MSHYQHRRPNQRYTHFDNEITGEYYPQPLRWYHHLAFVVMIIVVPLLIADLIFGAETVTNFIADLLGSLMN